MAYDVISLEELDPLPDRSATGYELSDHYVPGAGDPEGAPERGPRGIGLRVYRADPGERLSRGMHYHEEQEEIFVVVDGRLEVETPDETIGVERGEAIVIDPGSPQLTGVPADATEPAEVVAIGAPSYRVLGRNDARRVDADS